MCGPAFVRTVIRTMTSMYEYDESAPRDRSRFWKRGLVVATLVAGGIVIADLIPMVEPLVTHAQHRINGD